jgi:hypothetical protein
MAVPEFRPKPADLLGLLGQAQLQGLQQSLRIRSHLLSACDG